MGPKQILRLRVRVDPGVIAMKGYFTLSKYPELELHHQMQFSVRVDLGVIAMKGYSILSSSLELEPHHQMQLLSEWTWE